MSGLRYDVGKSDLHRTLRRSRERKIMKIRKVTCWVLRIPFTFPLVNEQQHALANFIEIETDDGLKGHALSTYPLKYGIRDFINREAAPAIEGMDALRAEEIRTKLFWATARKHFMA